MKILVIGATGTQGIPTVRQLAAHGHDVTGFSRGLRKADALTALGVKMIQGDLFSQDDLQKAMTGMDGVVYIPGIPTAGVAVEEMTVGRNVVFAAEKMGVQYLVHTSVDRAGDQNNFPDWGTPNYVAPTSRMYWICKSTVIEMIKASFIPHWTVVKPVYLMECFLPPTAQAAYPELQQGKLVSARYNDTRVAMSSADDIGVLIAKIFDDFAAFDHKELPLASDKCTMSDVAASISQATGKTITAISQTPDEMLADTSRREAMKARYDSPDFDLEAGMQGTVQAFNWDNVVGYTAEPSDCQAYGIHLTSFREWAEQHKADFLID